MKRIVRNNVGLGVVLAVPTFAVVAVTDASETGIHLIAIAFLAIGLGWRHLDGSL
jgi:hypothetical protein